MKILITGGTGFVGAMLSQKLLQKGHHVTAVDLAEGLARIEHEKYHHLKVDTTRKGPWQQVVSDHDAVVNLAGVSVFGRWNKKYKQAMYDSRILTTRRIVEAGPKKSGFVLVSASAVGYYGFCGDKKLFEDAPLGDDFLAGLCNDWEKEAYKAQDEQTRVVVARFGIVLHKNGGALKQMLPLFRLGLGGPLGSGNQWFSWIHADDIIEAFCFVLENRDAAGIYNFCSPNPVPNRQMTRALGRALKRPAFIPAPGFAMGLVLGEFATTLLNGQRAIPEKLTQSGFVFRHPEIEETMQNLMKTGF